jgi:dUTPase
VSFLLILNDFLSSGDAGKGYHVYFSPPPGAELLPTIWLDLHIAGDYYQLCEDDSIKRQFQISRITGKPFVRIPPRRGVRLYTEEVIGTDGRHMGIVTNIAGKAKHGIIVAPGKIDPGFLPNKLVLVTFNQSNSNVILNVGDKIAAVAFAQISGECKPTGSHGHFDGQLPAYDVSGRRKLLMWLASMDYSALAYDVLKMVIAAGLALIGAGLLGYLGIKKP